MLDSSVYRSLLVPWLKERFPQLTPTLSLYVQFSLCYRARVFLSWQAGLHGRGATRRAPNHCRTKVCSSVSLQTQKLGHPDVHTNALKRNAALVHPSGLQDITCWSRVISGHASIPRISDLGTSPATLQQGFKKDGRSPWSHHDAIDITVGIRYTKDSRTIENAWFLIELATHAPLLELPELPLV